MLPGDGSHVLLPGYLIGDGLAVPTLALRVAAKLMCLTTNPARVAGFGQ